MPLESLLILVNIWIPSRASDGRHEVQMGQVGTRVAIQSWDQFSSQSTVAFVFLRSEENVEKLLAIVPSVLMHKENRLKEGDESMGFLLQPYGGVKEGLVGKKWSWERRVPGWKP